MSRYKKLSEEEYEICVQNPLLNYMKWKNGDISTKQYKNICVEYQKRVSEGGAKASPSVSKTDYCPHCGAKMDHIGEKVTE